MKIKKLKLSEYIAYTLSILATIVLDQLTKLLAIKYLTQVSTLPIIEGVLHLTYTTNPGAAFGILPDNRWIFLTVSTVAIILMMLYLYFGNAQGKLYSASIILIVGGGIGNMIDRLGFGFYVNPKGVGEVIDFIDFRLINFAVFNVADSFVCIGAALLILALVIDLCREAKANKANKR